MAAVTVDKRVSWTNCEPVFGSALWRRVWNSGMWAFMYFTAAAVALLLAGLIGFICFRGIPFLTMELITSASSYMNGTIGILPNLLNTLYIIVIALGVALPVGVGAAVYLNEYAEHPRLIAVIETAAETLAGIPSIIFGLVGMLLFTQLFGLKQGVLAGGLTLVMLILPILLRTTQESLREVPVASREGALALGAGKWRTIRTVVLPNSMEGIVRGCILAIGRVVGESAALLFTAGFGLKLNGFFEALESSSATLTVALYIYASEQGEIDVAFAIAVVLLIVTLSLNIAVVALGKLSGRKAI